jgi:RNA polymerase sigma-70 factor (ECF subfamily)
MLDRGELQRVMTAAADGERSAVTPLFRALWTPLVTYATRFVGDRALAEDCAQDALVKLFAQLPRFDRDRDALTWALAITTWECRSVRRRVQRRGETGELARDGVPIDPIDGVAVIEDRELIRAALAEVDALAPRDREVVAAALTDDDELRNALAPATFRKRLERALSRLRANWRARHGTL